MSLRTLVTVCLTFFLFVIISYLFIGIRTHPTEGDSLNYHIPIAKAYFDGTILTPQSIAGTPYLKFSPGASEGILAAFYLFHISPNLYNVLGVIVLILALYRLGKNAGIEKQGSIIFATSVATLNGIVRWTDTQIIDIYLAAFFSFSLAYLLKPEKKVSYFLKLGIFLGMLAGSKYSGLIFAIILLFVFGKKLVKYSSFKNFLLFTFFFLFFGMSWYLRNFISTGNPLYPQGFLFFKDYGLLILKTQVWSVMTGSWYGFVGTINAVISEYMIWSLSIPLVLVGILMKRKSILLKKNRNILLLILVGFLNLGFYLFLPSDNKDFIMVSVIRYSYSAFIPFILCVFLLVQEVKKLELLGFLVIANMFVVGFPQSYNPKVLLLLIPIGIILYFVQDFKYKS